MLEILVLSARTEAGVVSIVPPRESESVTPTDTLSKNKYGRPLRLYNFALRVPEKKGLEFADAGRSRGKGRFG